MVSTTFRELGLSAPILRQLEKLEYKTPTPIQAACIPLLLQNKDLMGLAQTGTGKTAAFALPLIQQFSEHPRKPLARQVRALILSPTRELAAQIHDNICAYAKGLNLSTAVIFGGVGYAPQFKKLAGGLDILVATPGRLIDHLERQTVNLGGVETLILDEADHMLDMGFAPALKKIVAKIPKKRHTQMFSATMPDNILQLAQSLLQEPETVMVTPPAATADRVEQSLCMVGSQAEKRPLTLDLLEQQEQPGRTLIFTRTKHGANRLASFLTGKDHPASAIHGDKSQGTRERMLREFRSGETPILVATDIAARG
ncbi:DEAD/DEAH box helicase, partial [Akkermansia sp.]